MKILWLSKHSPLDSQLAELQRLFGASVIVHRDLKPFANAEDILKRFHAVGAQELVAVAPLTVIKALCEAGLRPLWAELEEVPLDSALVEIRTGRNGFGQDRASRAYRFSRFRRITGVDLQFEELE